MDNLRVNEASAAAGPEVLSEETCVQLLHENQVGRLAFAVAGQPEIFPVNYAMDGTVIVVHTSPGTKLRNVPRRRVAFEIDGVDHATATAWSVVVKGLAEDVTTRSDPYAAAYRDAPVHPWAPGERRHSLVIYPAEISGRCFRTNLSSATGSPAAHVAGPTGPQPTKPTD